MCSREAWGFGRPLCRRAVTLWAPSSPGSRCLAPSPARRRGCPAVWFAPVRRARTGDITGYECWDRACYGLLDGAVYLTWSHHGLASCDV
jgi:hypothetical protein